METNTVVIGASAAGLATAACLKRAGVSFELLEQTASVGVAWRGHYDRLHLHSSRGFFGIEARRIAALIGAPRDGARA